MSNENDTKTETATTVHTPADPLAKAPTLSEQTGVNMADATMAIAAMNARFDKLQEENGALRRALVQQQSQIEKMTAQRTNGKFASIPIEVRHCNACGREVPQGERCPVHKREKINEVGMGMKHNRMQPLIIRQV